MKEVRHKKDMMSSHDELKYFNQLLRNHDENECKRIFY